MFSIQLPFGEGEGGYFVQFSWQIIIKCLDSSAIISKYHKTKESVIILSDKQEWQAISYELWIWNTAQKTDIRILR